MRLLIIFILFLAVYAEMSVIINVGAEIGTFGVIAAMFLTAVIGLMLVRVQGFGVYRRMIEVSSRGEAPVDEMLHGVLLLLSGFLLIIPGFISDGIGAVLLIPFVRSEIITHGFMKNAASFTMGGAHATAKTTIIEGEFEQTEETETNHPAIEGEINKTENKKKE